LALFDTLFYFMTLGRRYGSICNVVTL